MWVDQRVIHLMADGIHQREGRTDTNANSTSVGYTGSPKFAALMPKFQDGTVNDSSSPVPNKAET